MPFFLRHGHQSASCQSLSSPSTVVLVEVVTHVETLCSLSLWLKEVLIECDIKGVNGGQESSGLSAA